MGKYWIYTNSTYNSFWKETNSTHRADWEYTQSPPTTSGIVVISGSNLFDRETSDFPVIQNLLLTSAGTRDQITLFNNFVLDLDLDLEVISTDVTTSGIVILNYIVDIGIPFVVPIVIDGTTLAT